MRSSRVFGKLRVQRHHLALTLVIAASILLAVLRIDAFQTGAYADDAWYINAATALARGEGYVRLWTPDKSPETFLPPGFPLLLTPVRWLFPDSARPLQVFSLLVTLGTVLLSWWYYKQRMNNPWQWLALSLLAVNLSMVGFSVLVMSEATYTLLSMLTLALALYLQRRSPQSITPFLLVGLLAAAAGFVRTLGVTLVGALILYYLVNKQIRRAVASAMPYLLLTTVWMIRNSAYDAGGVSYGVNSGNAVSFVTGLNQELPAKINEQWLQNLPNLLVPGVSGPRVIEYLTQAGLAFVSLGVGVLVVAIIVAGYSRQLRRGYTVAEIYAPLYLIAFTLAWPDVRYWLPLIPLLLLYFVDAFQWLATWLGKLVGRPKLAQNTAVLAISLLVLLHVGRNVQAIVDPVRNRIPDVAVAPQWIARNTDQGDVIMAAVPRVSYLYSGRVTIPLPQVASGMEPLALSSTEPAEQLLEAIREFGVDYVIVEPEIKSGLPFAWPTAVREHLVPAMDKDGERFRQVFADETTLIRVYEVQDGGADR